MILAQVTEQRVVLVSLETLEMEEALEVGGYNKFNFKHAGFWVLWYILVDVQQ